MVKETGLRKVPVRRSPWRHLGVLPFLATALLVTACAPSYEKVPFTPGTWSDDATHASVTLRADGGGSAVSLPYVTDGDMAFCPADGDYMSYTGPVHWTWGNDNLFMYLDALDHGRGIGFVAPWRQDDWSELEYWGCGQLDTPGILVMKRNPKPPSGG